MVLSTCPKINYCELLTERWNSLTYNTKANSVIRGIYETWTNLAVVAVVGSAWINEPWVTSYGLCSCPFTPNIENIARKWADTEIYFRLMKINGALIRAIVRSIEFTGDWYGLSFKRKTHNKQILWTVVADWQGDPLIGKYYGRSECRISDIIIYNYEVEISKRIDKIRKWAYSVSSW